MQMSSVDISLIGSLVLSVIDSPAVFVRTVIWYSVVAIDAKALLGKVL